MARGRVTRECVGLLLLLGSLACTKRSDPTDGHKGTPDANVNPQPAGREVVRVKADVVEIRGHALPTPPSLTELKKAIGEPSRTSELANTIYTWDDSGVVVYTSPQEDRIKELSFMFAELDQYKFAPKSASRHDIAFGAHRITPAWGEKQLRAAGFVAPELFPTFWDSTVGDVMVSVHVDAKTRRQPVSIHLDFSRVAKKP